MQNDKAILALAALFLSIPLAWLVTGSSAQTAQVLTGSAAFGSWKDDSPRRSPTHPAIRRADAHGGHRP